TVDGDAKTQCNKRVGRINRDSMGDVSRRLRCDPEQLDNVPRATCPSLQWISLIASNSRSLGRGLTQSAREAVSQRASPFGAPRIYVDRSKAARPRSSHRAGIARWPGRGPANGTAGISIQTLSHRSTIVCCAFTLPRARQLVECARPRLRVL